MCLTVKDEIDGLVYELDRAVSRCAGEMPGAQAFLALCHPAAVWIRNVYGAPQARTSAEFWEGFTGERAALGTAWQVKEIAERTVIAGTVAQRMSTFGWRPQPDAPWVGRGVRCLQLLKLPGRWTVASALWCDEHDGPTIPSAFFSPP